MSADLDRYFLQSPATDLYRRVRHLEVDVGGGLSIPLDKIIEEEARARCERLLKGHLEAVMEQEDIRERIHRDIMLLPKSRPPDLII